jgi:hypothetical protein
VLGAGAALADGGGLSAVVVLAAVGALVATKGWLRRAIAVVVIGLGVYAAVNGSIMAILAGLLIVAGGVVALVTCPKWPVMGSRYERASKTDDTDLWSAIDRGHDPTA